MFLKRLCKIHRKTINEVADLHPVTLLRGFWQGTLSCLSRSTKSIVKYNVRQSDKSFRERRYWLNHAKVSIWFFLFLAWQIYGAVK